MASSGALRHVSIGQYLPLGSPVHRLDPRTKLLGMILLVAATIFATSYTSNVALAVLILGGVAMARLPIGYVFSNVRPALPMIAILAIFQLLFYPAAEGAEMLLTFGSVRISAAALRIVVVSFLRFLDLLCLTSLLTNTTTTTALTRGMESLLGPLSAIGLPGHELAMVGAIALRFVPILGEQLESIMLAQASRGVSQKARGRWNLIANSRRAATLIIPLFVDAYRRGEEMALAMQARCYRGGRGRTHLVRLAFARRDLAALTIVTSAFALVLVLQQSSLP